MTGSSEGYPLQDDDESAAQDRAKIVFVVTEDWFFVSHFLPMVTAAIEAGLSPVVLTRVRDHRAAIEAAGARVVALEVERRDLRMRAVGHATRQMARTLRQERPAIVHCISLRSIVVGGFAARLAGIPKTVFALTGLGLIGARTDAGARAIRFFARHAIRHGLATRHTRFVMENLSDAAFLGLRADSPKVTVLGGAGVDPVAFPVTPLPPQPPLRLALVARMLWSKGVDTAVEAVELARGAGTPVTLSIYGAPDPSNPRAIPHATLERWSTLEGIEWKGRTEDVAAVWSDHHAALMPSRGGEGLPRSLLEAAACGRAIVTTDVPGCRDFVRHGIDGLITRPDDPSAVAAAITRLANDPAELSAMGASAHGRVLAGYRSSDVTDAMESLYRAMM